MKAANKGIKLEVATAFVVISTAVMLYTCQASSKLHPLILIPGNGGNQLEARLTAEYKPSSIFCKLVFRKDKEGWFRLWFDLSVILEPFTKCFAERMMLYYDQEVDDYHNAPGVETRVNHFGSACSLLYLNPLLKITAYMATLVKSLEQAGYVDGKTLFGAPYDFRYGLAAEGHPSRVGSKFLEDLKNLIESAYISNGGKPVILLSHSLGGLFVLQLLNRNPISWRQKYIQQFIALSTPWAGTINQMLTFASGNTLGVPLVDPLLVREEQRSSESNLWLLPSPTLFPHNRPLVVTPSATYSACDMSEFLKAIGFSQGVHPYESRTLPLVKDLAAPQVPVTCIVGNGVRTPEKLFYREFGFDKQPEIVYGDGDGTVNLVSLLALESMWAEEKNQSLKVVQIHGASHADILTNEAALDEILGEINLINSEYLSSVVGRYY